MPLATPRCEGCGVEFSSRNKLFRHLRETGCADCVRVVSRMERYVVLWGYVGSAVHGSQTVGVADEAARACAPRDSGPLQTAEGALLRAIEAATLGALQPSATACVAEVHSRAQRTEPGMHALANAVCVRIKTTSRQVLTAAVCHRFKRRNVVEFVP